MIKGNARSNHIMALGGNDQVRGYGGDDTIYGGNGDDTVEGDSGHDWITAQVGNDWVAGGVGDDREEGNDTIYVLPDAFADRIRCDDGTPGAGATDRVIFVGWRDPFDIVDPFGTCEIVLIQQELPPGWPYGAVPPDPALQGVQVTQRTAGRDHLR